MTAVLILLVLCSFASAERLIVRLSTAEVEINSNFIGTEVAVFGAVVGENCRSEPNDPSIVVVVRGPPQSIVTRQKERLFGLWINRSSRTISRAPAFYALHSSRALTDVASPLELGKYQIGLSNVLLVPFGQAHDAFQLAFLRLKQELSLYSEQSGTVDSPGADLFYAKVQIPANVPIGLYTTTVYLFHDGKLQARSDGSFTISKGGFEQFVFALAHQRPLAYGAMTALLAVFIGWLGGVIFRRD